MSDNLRKKEKHHDKIWLSKKQDTTEKPNISHISILSVLPNGKKILDVGCGTGTLAYELKKNRYDTTGLDISKFAIEKARKKGINAKQHDLDKKLPFADESFDCSICCQVLQHIFKPSSLIKEMTRVSKKYVVINVPNIAYWRFRLRLLNGKFPFIGNAEQLPIRFFTLKTLKEYISKSGLEIEKIEYVGGLPLRRFVPKAIRKKVNLLKYFPETFAIGLTVRCKKKKQD